MAISKPRACKEPASTLAQSNKIRLETFTALHMLEESLYSVLCDIFGPSSPDDVYCEKGAGGDVEQKEASVSSWIVCN